MTRKKNSPAQGKYPVLKIVFFVLLFINILGLHISLFRLRNISGEINSFLKSQTGITLDWYPFLIMCASILLAYPAVKIAEHLKLRRHGINLKMKKSTLHISLIMFLAVNILIYAISLKWGL